jgi:ribose transport system substrate-binding protein
MRSARRRTVSILAAATLALAVGCGDDGDDSGGASDAEEIEVGYSNPLGSDIALQSIGYGQEQAIEELGLPWTVNEFDADLSADKQVQDIDSMVTQQLGAVTAWTLNSGAMEPAYARAADAGIPVIGFNSESPSIDTEVKTETDSTCNVAEEQAAFIAERTPGAKVIAIEGPEVPTITFTTECFFDAAEAEGLDIIDSAADTSATEASGRKVAETLLAKNGDQVEAVWTFADQSGVGVSAAIDEAGLDIWTEDEPEGVVVVSRDGASSAMANIERGLLTASWDGNFSEMGAASIQLLEQHYVDGVSLDELPEEVLIEATRYDITNVDEYVDPLEREVPLPLEQ